MGYKIVSLITGVVGLLALIYVVLLFAGNKPDSATVIPAGIIAVIALPIAYVTNRLGRRDD
jgi:hypothetical protein